MEKKYIIIVVLFICLLVSFFYINHLRNERYDEYERCVDKQRILFEEKEELQTCFLDKLMYIQTCVLNCYDVECYERCDIKNINNNLVQGCVN